MAFATTDDLGDFVQRTLADQELATASLLLDLATAEVKTYTRQNIEEVEDDEVRLAGNWTRRLLLPNWPVTAVSSVIADPFTLVQPTDYTFMRNGTVWRPRSWPTTERTFEVWTSPFWGGPDREIVVTYTHGLTTIPDDCRLACIEHAAWRLNNAGGDLTRLQMGDWVEQYALGPDRGLTATSWKRRVVERRRASMARIRGLGL